MSKLLKRLSAVGVAGILALSLSGCGDKTESAGEPGEPEQSTAEQIDVLNATVADAFNRIEVEIVEEESDGSKGHCRRHLR